MHKSLIVLTSCALLSASIIRPRSEDHEQIQSIFAQDQDAIPISDSIHGATRQPWRPIQEKVKNTVVQVFVHVVEYDIFEPYKTPNQYASRGSGFLISHEGYIITNAHVVDQAHLVWIQIPSLGKHMIDVTVIGVSYDWDLALLKISDEGIAFIKQELGSIPYLELGDSDTVRRMDEVLALGYPLGHESLKSTAGHISGSADNLIQMSAPINPGSSGGPCLNVQGQVIGVSCSGVTEAQNVGFMRPSNDLKTILPDLCITKLVKKAFLGIIPVFSSEHQTKFLGNPLPGGCYAAEILNDSPLNKAGLQSGDMIYEVDGYQIDIYGQMAVPWSEDKIDLADYVARISIGDQVDIIYYRNGERHEATVIFDRIAESSIRHIYPGYDDMPYEIFGGLVVMNLALNHIAALTEQVSGLAKYGEMKNRTEPVLFISHVFPTSQAARTRVLRPGFIVRKVNGITVHTLDDFRNAMRKSIDSDYLALTVIDTISNASDNILVVIPFKKSLEDEEHLAADYRYPLSEFIRKLMREVL